MLADLTKLPPTFLANALAGTIMQLKGAKPQDIERLLHKRDALAAEVARRGMRAP